MTGGPSGRPVYGCPVDAATVMVSASRRVVLAVVLALLAAVPCTDVQAQTAAVVTEPRLVPAEQAARTLPRLNSLLVSWHDRLVLERYFHGAGPARPANIKSASKSVISALVGMAIDRGRLQGTSQSIGAFFGDLLTGAGDAPKRQITIEDLLTMRSGLQSTSNRWYGAWVMSPHWVRFALTRPLLNPPGEVMQYSTGNTHLLSAILTRATGSSTWQFAQDALARPLGFSLPRWTQDPQGVYFGGNEMLMTPRQMVAFGELYRHGGRVGGTQVVSARWVEQSFVARTRSPRSGQEYGYGWWITDLAGHRAYYAWGFGGQFIFVVPDLDLVVATTSSPAPGDERRSHRLGVYELVERLIVAPLADGGLPAPRS